MRKEIACWAVLRRRRKVAPHLADAGASEQPLQSSMLDAAREGTAAHHPGVDVQAIAIKSSSQYRDRSQRPELVFIADGDQHRGRRSQQPVPVGVGVATAVQVELSGLV